jgi:amino acid permease
MTNDTVNLLATMVGAGVAGLPVVAGVAILPLP